jgi:hypothetical protein
VFWKEVLQKVGHERVKNDTTLYYIISMDVSGPSNGRTDVWEIGLFRDFIKNKFLA